MLNSVIERRTVMDGLHRLILEVSEKEYETIYDQYTPEIAEEFLNYYLINRSDDGRPSDVEIKHDKNEHVVRIMANIHYTGNDEHTAEMQKAARG